MVVFVNDDYAPDDEEWEQLFSQRLPLATYLEKKRRLMRGAPLGDAQQGDTAWGDSMEKRRRGESKEQHAIPVVQQDVQNKLPPSTARRRAR